MDEAKRQETTRKGLSGLIIGLVAVLVAGGALFVVLTQPTPGGMSYGILVVAGATGIAGAIAAIRNISLGDLLEAVLELVSTALSMLGAALRAIGAAILALFGWD